jgi:RNA polymerase subunit RPABC4/transcription elongation factor Spt4
MVLVAVTAIFIVVIIGELLWLRSRRLKRRMGAGGSVKKSKDTLRDDAHNALITGRAIARTLERGGTPMIAVWSQLDEAKLAFDRGNYRVCIEIVDRTKETMKSSRLAVEKKGDLAKLESSTPPSGEDEMLTKEYIAKELPENFMQAKFSINLARDRIEDCRKRAIDTEAAALVLQDAERSFDGKDYSTALKLAVRCKNLLGSEEGGLETIPPEEEVIEITEEQLKNRCTGCGEFLAEGDSFCRKCGSKIPKAAECEKCGKVAGIDDKFCRGCGSELPS